VRKLLLVIGLKLGEIVGGIWLVVLVPYMIGGYIEPFMSRPFGPVGWVWFFGFVSIVVVAWCLFVLYGLISDVIPRWIRANKRWANRIMGEEKVYCHVCTTDDKDPVYHYEPVCKPKKKKKGV